MLLFCQNSKPFAAVQKADTPTVSGSGSDCLLLRHFEQETVMDCRQSN